MMEEKEGIIRAAPDSSMPTVGNNGHPIFDQLQYVEDTSNHVTKNATIKSPQTKNSMITSVQEVDEMSGVPNFLANTNIHNSLTPFQTTDPHEIDKSRGVCEDDRLLNAAKSGLTDVILHMIEEEGQQLHSHRDKV